MFSSIIKPNQTYLINGNEKLLFPHVLFDSLVHLPIVNKTVVNSIAGETK